MENTNKEKLKIGIYHFSYDQYHDFNYIYKELSNIFEEQFRYSLIVRVCYKKSGSNENEINKDITIWKNLGCQIGIYYDSSITLESLIESFLFTIKKRLDNSMELYSFKESNFLTIQFIIYKLDNTKKKKKININLESLGEHKDLINISKISKDFKDIIPLTTNENRFGVKLEKNIISLNDQNNKLDIDNKFNIDNELHIENNFDMESNKNNIPMSVNEEKLSDKNLIPLTMHENKFGIKLNKIINDNIVQYITLLNGKSLDILNHINKHLSDNNKIKNINSNIDFYQKSVLGKDILILVDNINTNNKLRKYKMDIYNINGIKILNMIDEQIESNKFSRKIDNVKVYFDKSNVYKKEISIKFKPAYPNKISGHLAKLIHPDWKIGTMDLETYKSGNISKVYAIGFYIKNSLETFYINEYIDSDKLILECLDKMLTEKYNGYNF